MKHKWDKAQLQHLLMRNVHEVVTNISPAQILKKQEPPDKSSEMNYAKTYLGKDLNDKL